MAEFKCISCGAIKESEKMCRCPTCGYKMYETPYERRVILLSEIRGFVKRLEHVEILPEYLSYYRLVPKKNKESTENEQFKIISKEKDDQRFPDFDTIRGYVCGASKTELFREHLDTAIVQIRKHIHETFSQEYKVNLDKVRLRIEESDAVLEKAILVLGLECNIAELEMPDIRLIYQETPDGNLVLLADTLLDELEALSVKIQKFIRQNNLYGTAYQHKTKISFKPSEENAYADDLRQCIKAVSKVNAQKYVVDLFSDGSKELDKMLKVLWNAVYAIMTLPVLQKKWDFSFADGTTAPEEDVCAKLAQKLHKRYAEVDDAIDSNAFLSDYDDQAVFAFYDRMIELDSLGFMGINKSDLLKIGESEAKLNELIGLNGIKESIQKIKAYALANKDRDDLNIHMCFLGNPGSGKTEVARHIAGILYENRILPTKKIIEVDRSGLVSQYFGATAEKTSRVIASAMGGVLFIDEAYALGNNSDCGITDYGKEAIDTLVKAMEDHRGQFCVILAGYKNEMLRMLSTNPGFKSRIQFTLDFPNYSRDELQSITELMLKNRRYTIRNAAMNRILDITDVKRKEPNFANAREIRNILDQVIMCQNVRCVSIDDKELGIVDVNKYIQDAKINLPTVGDGLDKKILTGEEELDQLIGLSAVKRMTKKIKAYAKRNKGQADFNLHMCFYGNPGTGKTEVARIISRILYDAGVLDEAKLVETDGQGLLGKFAGETAPKTEAKINEAMNGVLFIDEAYSLMGSASTNGGSRSYGDEAIAVLLKAMEDHRGRFCVILAGYKSEMKNMLSVNPGFESRIQFTLEFPDYSREELGEIAKAFLSKKKYDIEDSAFKKLLDIAEYFRNQPNFANARTVRNILDQVLMNQNLRTEGFDDDYTVTLDDVEDYLSDEGIDFSNPNKDKRTIGFI